MSETITAVYENGVLRPLSPLSLPEHQTVRLQILTLESAEASTLDVSEVIQSLVAKGLVTPPPHQDDIEPVSEKEWRELTERLEASGGKPLSEIIIEERGPY